MSMTDRQRKYALSEINRICMQKRKQLSDEWEKSIAAIPSVATVYAEVLAKDKAEQQAFVNGMVERLRKDLSSVTLATCDSPGRLDPPKLAKVRETYNARKKLVDDEYAEKAAQLDARAQQLERDIMLADLPPTSLALIEQFEGEGI